MRASTLCALLLCAGPAVAGPQSTDVRAKVAAGRALLEESRPEQAEVIFEEALRLDEGRLRTRVWLIRSWMDAGRVNDALDAIDELSAAGEKGPDLDYLYGMAFWRKAKKNLAEQADLGTVGMSFEDAVTFLSDAAAADPARYRDAHGALAESAYNTQRGELARAACERAADHYPDDPDVRFLMGRIALSQFTVAQADETRKEEADAHWAAAEGAFRKAAELHGRPKSNEARSRLAGVLVQLGNTLIWKQRTEEAREVFTDALGWDPAAVDFNSLQSWFDGKTFRDCLLDATKRYSARHGKRSEGAATISWWLGWAQLGQRSFPEAEEAFAAAVELQPDYVSSWFYVGLARYHRRDFEGSIEAFLKHWGLDPAGFVATLGYNSDTSVAIVNYLIGWCAENGRNVEAARLSEAEAELAPENPTYWNNVGLFWRDAGEQLAKSSRVLEDREQARAWYERSFEAYLRALALSPEDPSLLNDGAVLLQYYLRREYPRAKEMYEKAILNAELALREGRLPSGQQALVETAYRDARNNLALLEEKMARDREKEEGKKGASGGISSPR